MFWGRVLGGEKSHWCPDLDFLPIDETTPFELSCCTCHLPEQELKETLSYV